MPGLQVSIRPRRVGDALAVIWQYAPDLDRTSLLDVDAAVTRWWAHARVVTTWETPPMRPYVPCPSCRVKGRLRVVDQPLAVICLECAGAWDGLTVDQLGEHMRLALADPIPDPGVVLAVEASQA